jgi:hypothetical protein
MLRGPCLKFLVRSFNRMTPVTTMSASTRGLNRGQTVAFGVHRVTKRLGQCSYPLREQPKQDDPE